jgi:protein-disulfide isomerase
MYKTTASKADIHNKLNSGIVEQYRKLALIGDPDVESPYKIHMAGKNFADSPIRISVFSDFECPFCKVVSDQLPELVRRYPDKISIQYFYFPLDAKCNSNIKSRFHENACDAASIAACDEKKFHEVHDEIFKIQAQLASGALSEIAAKYELKNCLDNKDVLNKVITSINQGTKYNLKSTPTIILNGKKIEGSIPSPQFFAIFEDILADN